MTVTRDSFEGELKTTRNLNTDSTRKMAKKYVVIKIKKILFTPIFTYDKNCNKIM